jgi:hypothetical protein
MIQAPTTLRQRLRRAWYFFPLQLLWLHLKKNHLLLLCWVLLWAYVLGNLGEKYGIPYLFLYPEYFGEVNVWSYMITGFALGGFITAFNLYTYTAHAHRFPFICTVARPFVKFSINNSLIPIAFVGTYLWCAGAMLSSKELVAPWRIAQDLLGFLLGLGLFTLLAYLYFVRTNTDVVKLLGSELDVVLGDEKRGKPFTGTKQLSRKVRRWIRAEGRTRKWKVETYLATPWRVALARTSAHYDRALMDSVLWQNHINGSIFEVAVVASFLLLGAFSDMALFAIPAAASAFLLFTMFLMVASALFSWFKGWATTVLIALVVLVSSLGRSSDRFFYDSQAFGINYHGERAPYEPAGLGHLAYDAERLARDKATMTAVLERWLVRQTHGDTLIKPKLMVLCASGGGLRSTLWTYHCMQHADSLLNGELLRHTAFMSGSSGGLVGAAYYRQLQWLDTLPSNAPGLLDRLSGDVLNPLAFSFVTNDMFIRYRRITDGHYFYTKDRGYTFEREINDNTQGVLDVRMQDMVQAESRAEVPVLAITPTIINDGRRLVIGSSPLSFLCDNRSTAQGAEATNPEAVELAALLPEEDARLLKLTSALRMSCTFPYITPVVSLPTTPKVGVMDAGIRDNYGYRAATSFLFAFREWIAARTSGVILLQVRDKEKVFVKDVNRSLVGRAFDPAANVYENFLRVQDQEYDAFIQQTSTWADFPLHVVDLTLRARDRNPISLSWHLTAVEKKHVLEQIHTPWNQAAFARLQKLLEPERLMPSVNANGTQPVLEAGQPLWPANANPSP